MSRRPAAVVLAILLGVLLALETGRADHEAQLLQKFQQQNQGQADFLRKDVLDALQRLDKLSTADADRTADLLRHNLLQLQDDVSLPKEERQALMRKLEKGLRDVKEFVAVTKPKPTLTVDPLVFDSSVIDAVVVSSPRPKTSDKDDDNSKAGGLTKAANQPGMGMPGYGAYPGKGQKGQGKAGNNPAGFGGFGGIGAPGAPAMRPPQGAVPPFLKKKKSP